MKFRALGPNAPDVTAVGFGGMPLSIRDRPSERQALQVLAAVLDAGVTLIDTADVYCLDDDDIGHNERLIAQALDAWSGDRERLVVATKGGLTRPGGRWERNGHPDHLRRACERSLKALRVDRIDLYQLHAPDPAVPFEDSVGALADLQREGKVRSVGLSNVSVALIDLARHITPVVSVQNRLNPFFREAVDAGVVAHCERHGIGFIAYSPLGGGRLNQTLPAHPVVRAVAERLGCSPHAAVVAWVLAQSPNVIAIPGARSADHARDSIGAADITLSADDLKAIGAAEFSTGR